MARKKNKRPADAYQLPPHVDRARRAVSRAAGWKPRPELPRRRVILAGLGMSLLCAGMTAAFWLPPHSLVRDLRARGVTAAATVVGVDSKPKYVKVRFVSGPHMGVEVKLSDYAGMYPEAHPDGAILVTYDPEKPSRALTNGWVEDPPANLPAYGTSALTLVCLSLTTAAAIRRVRILRSSGPGLQSKSLSAKDAGPGGTSYSPSHSR
ncbi:hypothetical protein [Streptomyces massasporeus]|uniref:hypothetical protein n=1 Tax=Streptomyces massasporeus TaxID=67324 RepID=UPI0016759F2F|nr:hypothetical protein [Streptomyces massasporeus]GGV83074.1 hypothetical protein GCM10010228_58810 [Streptomyces massasporeus]